MKIKTLLVIATLNITGCSSIHTQDGVNLSDKTSYITITTESDKTHTVLRGLNHRLSITSLDDESLFNLGWTSNFAETIHVRPGPHKLVVRDDYLNSYAKGCLLLDAKQGENYIIRKYASEYSIRFWIERLSDNEPVSENCG